MNARELLETMIRTNRGSMTVWSPAEVRNALNAHWAAAFREAAEVAAQWNSDCQNCAVELEVARELRRRATEAGKDTGTPGESAQPADLTVYRAEHDSIVMGLYTTASEARAHCVAEERRAWASFENPTFDWIEDEEDGVAELVTVDEDGETETITGYVVTPLTVASEYDEEADE